MQFRCQVPGQRTHEIVFLGNCTIALQGLTGTWRIFGHMGMANLIVVDLTSSEIQGEAARGRSTSWTARKVTGRN